MARDLNVFLCWANTLQVKKKKKKGQFFLQLAQVKESKVKWEMCYCKCAVLENCCHRRHEWAGFIIALSNSLAKQV